MSNYFVDPDEFSEHGPYVGPVPHGTVVTVSFGPGEHIDIQITGGATRAQAAALLESAQMRLEKTK